MQRQQTGELIWTTAVTEGQGTAEALRRLYETLEVWYQRGRQRQQLARLTDWQLRDIGITRAQAEQEARRPFWRA